MQFGAGPKTKVHLVPLEDLNRERDRARGNLYLWLLISLGYFPYMNICKQQYQMFPLVGHIVFLKRDLS
jgi:hypothetical protein